MDGGPSPTSSFLATALRFSLGILPFDRATDEPSTSGTDDDDPWTSMPNGDAMSSHYRVRLPQALIDSDRLKYSNSSATAELFGSMISESNSSRTSGSPEPTSILPSIDGQDYGDQISYDQPVYEWLSSPALNGSNGTGWFGGGTGADQITGPPTEVHWIFLSLIILAVIGVLGNVLVCVAVSVERRLQNATNYFLVSLAVADLLVALVVMPIAILYELYGGIWPFGTSVCITWVTFDVFCSTSSIIHLCFISIGRYSGIKDPIQSRQGRFVSRRMVLLKIFLAWALSAVITSPITIFSMMDHSNVQPDPYTCAITNRYFMFVGSFSAFYIPMVVMVITYVRTTRLLNQKAQFYRDGRTVASSDTLAAVEEGQEPTNADQPANSNQGSGENSIADGPSSSATVGHGSTVRTDSSSSDEHSILRCHGSSGKRRRRKKDRHQTSVKTFNGTDNGSGNGSGTTSSRRSRWTDLGDLPMIRTLGSSVQVRNEQKATKVLGLVFTVFVICWAPFFTLNVLLACQPDIGAPAYLPTVFQWLGFLSSIMNPLIYTVFNRNFRRAFRTVLSCQMFSNPSSMLRKRSQFDPYRHRTNTAAANHQRFTTAGFGETISLASFGGDVSGSRKSRTEPIRRSELLPLNGPENGHCSETGGRPVQLSVSCEPVTVAETSISSKFESGQDAANSSLTSDLPVSTVAAAVGCSSEKVPTLRTIRFSDQVQEVLEDRRSSPTSPSSSSRSSSSPSSDTEVFTGPDGTTVMAQRIRVQVNSCGQPQQTGRVVETISLRCTNSSIGGSQKAVVGEEQRSMTKNSCQNFTSEL